MNNEKAREIFKRLLQLKKNEVLQIDLKYQKEFSQSYKWLNNLRLDYIFSITDNYIEVVYRPQPKSSVGLLRELKNIVGIAYK